MQAAIERSAFLLVAIPNGAEVASHLIERIDEPVRAGSIAKVVTLAAALDAGVIDRESRVRCTRTLHLDAYDVTCVHPDLVQPLDPIDALAHSCNLFFASAAERLSRAAFNRAASALGFPPAPGAIDIRLAALGLAGERVPPRALLAMLQRIVQDDVPSIRETTRAVLLEGLRYSAEEGTASVLADRGLRAWAKTGTAPGVSGGYEGLAVAVTADRSGRPSRGIVVRAPGAAGRDAMAIAAEILVRERDGAPGAAGGDAVTVAAEILARERDGAPGAAGRDAVTIVAEISTRDRDGTRLFAVGDSGDSPRSPSSPPEESSHRLTVRVLRLRTAANAGAGMAPVVETVALEDYVAEVVAGEAPADAPAAALDTLAITARTFALTHRGRHAPEGFDLCDLTHCQVLRPPSAASTDAAARTAGRVLVESRATEGASSRPIRPAVVFHSASCGGTLVAPADVWTGAQNLPYLRTGADPAAHPVASWQTDVPAEELHRALAAAGFRGRVLRDLRVLARTNAGLVARVGLDGLAPNQMEAESFRRVVGHRLGWHVLKSNRYEITRTAGGYRFTGRGRGHGIGLCLRGAVALAEQGRTSAQILRTYFPGLVGAGLDEMRAARQQGGGREVRISLPAFDEQARPRLSALVDRTLADLERETGQPRPAIHLRAHPTIESFQRATGLAWWTAGATTRGRDEPPGDGEAAVRTVDLHLVPLSVLERRGILASTVRHELSHALTLDVLGGRPLWVREGIALHFAGEQPSGPSNGPGSVTSSENGPGPISCPADAELRRSGSPDALADALARALACVERELERGVPWREVGR